jgi:hypothetical protein
MHGGDDSRLNHDCTRTCVCTTSPLAQLVEQAPHAAQADKEQSTGQSAEQSPLSCRITQPCMHAPIRMREQRCSPAAEGKLCQCPPAERGLHEFEPYRHDRMKTSKHSTLSNT